MLVQVGRGRTAASLHAGRGSLRGWVGGEPRPLEQIIAGRAVERTSLWHATTDDQHHAPLDDDAETDVVVVGGGITGLTTAALLTDAGIRVMVLEARGLAAGTTGGTTGKLTSQHGLIYASLVRRHGDHVARQYGEANEAAIRQVRQLCDQHGVDAELTPGDAYVYATTEESLPRLRQELDAARRVGLPAEWADTTELPFPVLGALRFTGQAQIHAVKYCQGLARNIDRSTHGAVHCDTRVTSVRERGSGVTVQTERGTVRANDVVLATLLPLTNRGLEFARARPMRSYGIAAAIRGHEVPQAMYMSAEQPTRSIRHYHGSADTYVVVVGEGHEVGHARDTHRNDEALEAFAREHFDVRDVPHRWSAQDQTPDDRLPLIGTTAASRRIHVATGFQKWGLTTSMVAATILRDIVQRRSHPLQTMFAPTRVDVRASLGQFLRHNADVAKRLVADRLLPDARAIEDVPPGGGATVRAGGRLLAVSRGQDGTVTTRSAVCTHLGCIVQWNDAERSWDCPCHGSRFTAQGQVLDGPATAPLDER